MKQVAIVIPRQVNLASFDNPRRAFLAVNDFRARTDEPPLFDVKLVGEARQLDACDGLFQINVDRLISEAGHPDLILIPSFDGDAQQYLQRNTGLAEWIRKHYELGAEVASFCMGAYLLAATGLLTGKNCSTHWKASSDFSARFPDIQLTVEKIITDEDGIYTSGGAFSSANLVLYLVEKFAGRQAAIFCSKLFQVQMDRNSQSPFIIFQGLKNHDDPQVKLAQEFIEKNYQDKITVDQLSAFVALSRRSLERRFKKATSNTLIQYIQRVKIEAAKKSFEMSPKNVNEVMYEVGYADTKAFRTVFRDITGLTPMEYRNRYNMNIRYN